MDGLSGAASVIGVVSLAIQLADSVKKLLNFWDSVQNAPDNVKAMAKGLRVLSVVLDNIETHQKLHGEDQTTTELLDSCRDHVTALMNLTM
jgi:HPt (histidine-containing phosphotransfer) domain-containing protein